MLCGAFSFACMGAFAHGLGGMCDWQTIALARAAFVLVFAAAMAKAAGVQLVLWRPGTLWVRSIAGSISMLCTFYALPRLPIADVLTLSNMFPVWIALASWPLLGERPSLGVWLAIACAISGVAIVEWQPGQQEINSSAFVVLGGSVSTAVAMMGLHRLGAIDVRAIVVHFSAVATLFCAASILLLPGESTKLISLDPRILLMLLGVGLFATIGQILLTRAFTTGEATKVSVVALSQIGFAMLFDVLFWGRHFTATTLVGMVLVATPTAWLMWEEAGRGAADEPAALG
jgi:drug/metabolite transporter (DMT)-like permease